MSDTSKRIRIIRWLLSVALVAAGLSLTWAWGQVARLAEPTAANPDPGSTVQFALWHPAGSGELVLHRSIDEGTSWQPLVLPANAEPWIWASDGGDRLAVASQDDLLFLSHDQGESWQVAGSELPILSLTWNEFGELYLGTDRQGVYHLAADRSLVTVGETTSISASGVQLASSPVVAVAAVDGRLFAATPTALFYTDIPTPVPVGAESVVYSSNGWSRSVPVSGGISTLVAKSRETVFVGTETLGVFTTINAGQSWQPVSEGLGLAAGQMVNITALRAAPIGQTSTEAGSAFLEDDLLYAAVDHVLGSSQVHASAEGVFVTLDGGASWQPLAGPSFPQAQQSTDLVLVPGKPLYVQAVTAGGLQTYAPDIASALAALKSDDPKQRASGVRLLGLAQADQAATHLLSMLSDPEPMVSLAAADGLGRIGDPAIVGGLLVALEHPNEQVRLGAARALGLMRVEAAVEPLRTMLINKEGAAVAVAAEALGRVGSRAATDALLVALDSPAGTSRWHAALSALEIMGEPAVGPLSEMLSNGDPYARRNAAEALGWIGSPTPTPVLLGALEDDSPAVREQAAWALGEIGDPAVRAELERLQSRDPSPAVQVAAGSALTRIQQQPREGVGWLARWAPMLQRLQAVRWTLLALSVAAAVWLAGGHRGLLRPRDPLRGGRT